MNSGLLVGGGRSGVFRSSFDIGEEVGQTFVGLAEGEDVRELGCFLEGELDSEIARS